MNRTRIRTAAAAVTVVLAVTAIARDDRRLTWIAIGAAVAVLLLRFVTRPRSTE
jgi:hypothetical protein